MELFNIFTGNLWKFAVNNPKLNSKSFKDFRKIIEMFGDLR